MSVLLCTTGYVVAYLCGGVPSRRAYTRHSRATARNHRRAEQRLTGFTVLRRCNCWPSSYSEFYPGAPLFIAHGGVCARYLLTTQLYISRLHGPVSAVPTWALFARRVRPRVPVRCSRIVRSIRVRARSARARGFLYASISRDGSIRILPVYSSGCLVL